MNSTLVYFNSNESVKLLQSNQSSAVIFPFSSTSNAFEIWNFNYHRNAKTAIQLELNRMDSIPFNFVYCDRVHKQIVQQLGFFHYLLSPFEPCVWLVLGIVVFATGLLAIKDYKSCPGSRVKRSCKILTVLWSYPLMLVTDVNPKLKKSFLHVWLLFGFTVINTYYNGYLTTELAVPLPTPHWETLPQLSRENFSLLYLSKSARNNALNSAQTGTNADFKRLVGNAVITSTLVKDLTTGAKQAFVDVWTFVLKVAQDANRLLKETRRSNTKHRKECYIGKNLFNFQSYYFILSVPSDNRLTKVFRGYLEFGVYHLWMREYTSWSITTRIQERSKFISPTIIRTDQDDASAQIDFKAKLMTVFNFWSILCLFCCAVALAEHCFRSCNQLVATISNQ